MVLFRVATLYIACVAGVLRGGKGERRARKAREDRDTFFLLCSFSLSSLPFYGLPRRLLVLCINVLLPQNNYVLGCLECCYHDHQMQKRLMVVGVTLLIHSGNFYGLEIWHEIFWGLNFGPGIFLDFV